MAHKDLDISESDKGRILVVDAVDGHKFEFRLSTGRGKQSIEAMAPAWAGGREPPSAERWVIEARQRAEREASDQGWLESDVADVDQTS